MGASLRGRVALVTGASRGIGKGIAQELGAAGASVYVTGRSMRPSDNPLAGTVGETAEQIGKLGGEGIAVVCDHSDDDAVRALFERIRRERGRLDVLVNNACSGQTFADRHTGLRFWEQPLGAWEEAHDVGLRSAYVATWLAAPMMIERRSGLVVNVSSFGAVDYLHSVAYGTGKAALDRLSRDCAHELREHGVAVVSIWPGIVKTELVLSHSREEEDGRLVFVHPQAERGIDGTPDLIDLSFGETPRYSGRAVVALAGDASQLERSGQALAVGDLAREYGFRDIDGGQPPPLVGSASTAAAAANGA